MSFFTRISATKTPAGETHRQCRQIPTTSGNLLNVSLLEDTNATLGRLQPRAPSSFFFFFTSSVLFIQSFRALTLTLIANSLSGANDFSRCLTIFMSCIIAALKWFSSLTRSHFGTAQCFIARQKMHLLRSLLLQGISGFLQHRRNTEPRRSA